MHSQEHNESSAWHMRKAICKWFLMAQILCVALSQEINSWYFAYDSETKRQSTEWCSTSSPGPKKLGFKKFKIKTMLITFFWLKGNCKQRICAKETKSQCHILSIEARTHTESSQLQRSDSLVVIGNIASYLSNSKRSWSHFLSRRQAIYLYKITDFDRFATFQ